MTDYTFAQLHPNANAFTAMDHEIFDAVHQLHQTIYRGMQFIQADNPKNFAGTLEWRRYAAMLSAAGLISSLAYEIPQAIDREYAPLPYTDANG